MARQCRKAMSWCNNNGIRTFCVPTEEFYVEKRRNAHMKGFKKVNVPFVRIAVEVNGNVVRVGDMDFKQSDPRLNDKMQEIYQFYYQRNNS